MAAPKGHKRYGGRQKGTPNKRSSAFDERYDELVAKYEDPFEVLFRLLAENDPSIRMQAAKELCSYKFPKKRAVEVSGPDQGALDVNVAGTSGFVQEFIKVMEAYARERDKG